LDSVEAHRAPAARPDPSQTSRPMRAVDVAGGSSTDSISTGGSPRLRPVGSSSGTAVRSIGHPQVRPFGRRNATTTERRPTWAGTSSTWPRRSSSSCLSRPQSARWSGAVAPRVPLRTSGPADRAGRAMPDRTMRIRRTVATL